MFRVNFKIMDEEVVHSRKVLNLVVIFRDLGGLATALMGVFSFFLSPYAEFTFILSFAQEFFKAKTEDPSVFSSATQSEI